MRIGPVLAVVLGLAGLCETPAMAACADDIAHAATREQVDFQSGPATVPLQCEPLDIAFVSANSWDVAGAAHFGFRAVWLNRGKAPAERLPARPALEIASLAELAGALPA